MKTPLEKAAAKYRKIRDKAYGFDSIPTDATFAVLSDNNPYARKLNEATGALLVEQNRIQIANNARRTAEHERFFSTHR